MLKTKTLTLCFVVKGINKEKTNLNENLLINLIIIKLKWKNSEHLHRQIK